MHPVVYFRTGLWSEEAEFNACQKYFDTVRYRTEIPGGSLVIPRYSMLPFAFELSKDVENCNSTLINTVDQHEYVADIRRYYPDLEGITPKTWTTWNDLPEGSYVVKGSTNSRKHEWNTRCFCKTKADIPRVANSLYDDDLIRDQGIVVREYIPLVTYGEGLNGMPITNEWRFFVLDGKILVGGYYWASEPDCCPGDPMSPPEDAIAMVEEALTRVGDKIRFFVVDVGETQAGGWIVIELNDGCMSGPSMIDYEVLYKKLAEAFK